MKRLFIIAAAVLTGVAYMHAEGTRIVAHRGHWNAEGSAHNSIRSLVKADSVGADATEFDVHVT